MDPITTWLLAQGPAGILAVAIIVLYRSGQTQAKDHAVELKELHKAHKAELEIVVERHRITTNKMLDKTQEVLLRVGGQRRRRTGVVAVNVDGEET